jgi:Rap1a immunity proteins
VDWYLFCLIDAQARVSAAAIASSQNLAQVNKLKPASCIPYDVTADQAKLIIEKFLTDNPQYMQLSAAMVAAYALVIAFPCR